MPFPTPNSSPQAEYASNRHHEEMIGENDSIIVAQRNGI
jgi:hypothetical protein